MMASSQSFSSTQRRMLLSPWPASPVNSAEPLCTSAMRLRDTATEAEAIIAALQERRSALISAAVTGQIDVRRAPEQAP